MTVLRRTQPAVLSRWGWPLQPLTSASPSVCAHTLEKNRPDHCLVLTIKYWLGNLKFRNDLGAPRRGRNVLCPAALWAIYLLSASSTKLTESIQTCLKRGLTHFLPPGAVVGRGQPWETSIEAGAWTPICQVQGRQGCWGTAYFHSLHWLLPQEKLMNLELSFSLFFFQGFKEGSSGQWPERSRIMIATSYLAPHGHQESSKNHLNFSESQFPYLWKEENDHTAS